MEKGMEKEREKEGKKHKKKPVHKTRGKTASPNTLVEAVGLGHNLGPAMGGWLATPEAVQIFSTVVCQEDKRCPRNSGKFRET